MLARRSCVDEAFEENMCDASGKLQQTKFRSTRISKEIFSSFPHVFSRRFSRAFAAEKYGEIFDVKVKATMH